MKVLSYFAVSFIMMCVFVVAMILFSDYPKIGIPSILIVGISGIGILEGE